MKEIKILVSQIETLTGEKYEIDYVACYGGYLLLKNEGECSVGNHNEYFTNAFSNYRLPNKEFKSLLIGVIMGLQFKKMESIVEIDTLQITNKK